MYICVCHKITDKYLNDMIKESKITTVKNFCLNTE
jgi:bacterioferritin-associated ferredoxin